MVTRVLKCIVTIYLHVYPFQTETSPLRIGDRSLNQTLVSPESGFMLS